LNNNNSLNPKHALIILILGAIGISFSPVIVKLVGHNAVGSTAIGFWRTFIGGIVLLLIASVRKYPLRMTKVPLLWCVFTGFCFALDLSVWHRSIMYIGAGMATVIGNTQVFATSLISHFVFKERLTRRFLIAAPAAVFGLALLVGVFSETVVFTSRYITGVTFGLCTAALYSLYMVGIKKATDHKSNPSPVAIMTWICFTAAIFLAIGSFFEEMPFIPQGFRVISLLLVLGIVGQALAWWGIASAIKHIAIHHAALILVMQPVLAMIWEYLLFGELLGIEQIAGAVITVSAIYAGSVKKT
jgi:drug/metabolite transporter (DMT)-like permease